MAQDGIISPLAVESKWMTGMRCLVCGAEMHLIEAKPDETLMFSGTSNILLSVRAVMSHGSCRDPRDRAISAGGAGNPVIASEPQTGWIGCYGQYIRDRGAK